MNTIRKFLAHILYHRESYLIPAGVLVLLVLAARWVAHITGRAVVDDPGVIVGYLLNGVGIALVLLLTGITQEHFFGYRSKGRDPNQPTPLADDIYDACITTFLLSFFAALVFSLLR